MNGIFKATDMGTYYHVYVEGPVQAETYLEYVRNQLEEVKGARTVFGIIEQHNHPSVLGFDEIMELYRIADSCNIGYVCLFFVNKERGRSLLGDLASNLMDRFSVKTNIAFFSNMNDALAALEIKRSEHP